MDGRLRRRWVIAAAAAAMGLGLTVAWLFRPSSLDPAERERHYRSETACLLTDDLGLAGAQAKAAWAGMQEASAATLIKVQYLAVSGPQTAANASAFFNSLGLQGCQIIIAVGEAPVAAMVDGGSRFPDVRLIAVGGERGHGAVMTIDAAPLDGMRAAVRAAVEGTV